MLAANVRLEHLSPIECERMFNTLWSFNDIVFLPGDKLKNTMVKIECPLPTKTCQPSVSKMYRPAKIHKPEISKQT